MSRLAIQGLLAITSALWVPTQADTNRPPWSGETRIQERVDGEERHTLVDAAENSLALIKPGSGELSGDKGD